MTYDHLLEIRCLSCDHIGRLMHTTLLAHAPAYTRLSVLERRFRCARCRLRTRTLWQIVQAPSRGPPS